METSVNNDRTINSISLDRPPSELFDVGYQPNQLDICSGRGKKHWNAPGNVAFRSFMQNQLKDYMDASSKTEKSQVVDSIVQNLRGQGCQFLKQKEGRWYDIGDQGAREKVGHSLRDQVTALKKEKKLEQSDYRTHRRTDSSNEADLRRSELDSTQMLTEFARRPSWLASEKLDPDDFKELQNEYMDTFDDNVMTVPPASFAEQYRSPSVFQLPKTSPPVWQDTSQLVTAESDLARNSGLLRGETTTYDPIRTSDLMRGSLLSSIGSWTSTAHTSGRSSIRLASSGHRHPVLLDSINSGIFADESPRTSGRTASSGIHSGTFADSSLNSSPRTSGRTLAPGGDLRMSDISIHSGLFDELMGEDAK